MGGGPSTASQCSGKIVFRRLLRLCKCAKQRTLPTFAQPPRRLRNIPKPKQQTDVYTKYLTLPKGRLKIAQDEVPDCAGLWRLLRTGVLSSFQPSLRDWSALTNPTQDCVLGYTQPSLR